MQLLSRLATERRMTVVCTIHQPRSSIFALFDKLLVLDHGKTAFFGDAKRCAEYFEREGFSLPAETTPSDYFIDVVNGQSADFSALFEKAPEHARVVTSVETEAANSRAALLAEGEGEKEFATSNAKQLVYIFGRLLKDFFRNPQAGIINVGQAIFLGLIVGSVFYQIPPSSPTANNAILGILIFSLMAGSFPITQFAVNMVLDRPLINRDRASGLYSAGAYFGARSLLDLPLLIAIPLIFNSILYFMVGLRGTPEAFFTFLGVCILNCICAGSLYSFLGSFSPNALVATLLAFIGTVFLMLFAGFFVPLPILPVWWGWMSWISFFRWSFQSVMINQFAGTVAGDVVLVNYGFDGWAIYNGCLGLIAQIIIFRVLTFVVIKYANKEKR